MTAAVECAQSTVVRRATRRDRRGFKPASILLAAVACMAYCASPAAGQEPATDPAPSPAAAELQATPDLDALLQDVDRTLKELNSATAAAAKAEARAKLARLLLQLEREKARIVREQRLKRVPDCRSISPHDCPPVPRCDQVDACVVLRLPPVETGRPTLTHHGTYAFALLFKEAAARGVENVMVRAMNATRVCPSCAANGDKPCSRHAPPATGAGAADDEAAAAEDDAAEDDDAAEAPAGDDSPA